MNFSTDLILGEAFYMFIFWSFISQILNFLYWLVFRLNPKQFTRTPITVCAKPCWHVIRWFDDAKPIWQQFLLQRFFRWQRPQVSFFTRLPGSGSDQFAVWHFPHMSPLNEMILDISALNTDIQIIRRPWHISLVSALLLGAAAIRLTVSWLSLLLFYIFLSLKLK